MLGLNVGVLPQLNVPDFADHPPLGGVDGGGLGGFGGGRRSGGRGEL